MPVKTELDTSAPIQKARKYPYIGIIAHPSDGDLIVLFDGINTGTVLKACKSGLAVGTHSSSWQESMFAVLQLPLVMENI